jgi:hypothetical protein
MKTMIAVITAGKMNLALPSIPPSRPGPIARRRDVIGKVEPDQGVIKSLPCGRQPLRAAI